MPAPQPPLATLRAVHRLAAPCILDAVMVGRLDREFVDALILLAVVQANVAPLMRDRDAQRAYASYDAPPPDELRRPVSINAIAHSLRLPYETVRRRVMRLAKSGACEVSAHGVVVPARELASPQHMAALLGIWEQIRRLYYRLRDLGVLDALVEPHDRSRPAADVAPPPLRAVIRIASDYMLRTVDNVTRQFDGLISGLIWHAVMSANREHLEAGVEDGQPRPVRTAQIAERLAAPAETVRRHVVELLDAGLCQRVRGGLVVPAEVLGRPTALQAMQNNFADLQRMFAGFAQLGVLTEWDRQSPPLEGVA
jgi:DNA-binding Lrp family transcriptional regulator